MQPTSPLVDDHLIEHARANKRHDRREPITGRMVADLLQAVGVGHVVAVDLPTPQIEGFFHVPVDNFAAVPVLCQSLAHDMSSDLVIVDVGSKFCPTVHWTRYTGSRSKARRRRD